MKFGIDIGHNCPPDTGAVGVKKEDDLTKDVGTRLISKLSSAGHSVVNCTPTSASSENNSLSKRVKKANDNKVDLFVSIHFNAFKATDKAMGSEIYGISKTSQAIAKSVLAEILKLGFKDRGIKDKPVWFVLQKTSMPAILIECCFIDSKEDMRLFDAESMAEAIKVGLIGDTDNTSSPQPTTLKITKKTILKPSTEQSTSIPKAELVDIVPGSYPVLDVRLEERHYWVKWTNNSQANRDEHFVFVEHAELA